LATKGNFLTKIGALSSKPTENLTEKQLLVTFKQSYTSDSYHDIVVKTLTMEKEENGWKIIKEREVKVIRE
jgi:hypothetical protein